MSYPRTSDGDSNPESEYHRLYMIWCGMKRRCHNTSHKDYGPYGSNGIEVCREWRNSYLAFKEWSLANGYKDHLTIDRIDSLGDYGPNNCRWATYKEQNNNRLNNVVLQYMGKELTLAQLARRLDMNYRTIKYRYYRYGPDVQLLTKPVQSNGASLKR
jgi:hypothetical protein